MARDHPGNVEGGERRRPARKADQHERLSGEPTDTDDHEEARLWAGIYRRLARFHQLRVERASREGGPTGALVRSAANATAGRDFWEGRLGVVGAIDLNAERRLLLFNDRVLKLSRRETELLRFLAEHPDRHVTAHELLESAWGNPDLSHEQVRGYVRRIRRRLQAAEAPFQIVTEKGDGYAVRWRQT